jgi:hypothetical protein
LTVRVDRWTIAALAATGAAALALIGAEIVSSSSAGDTPRVSAPCAARTLFGGGGIDATVQRVVLDGLDLAACRLQTTREQFVLSLAPGAKGQPHERARRIAALRAGLRRAVDRGEARGDVPPLLAPVIRQVVEHAPIGQILEGRISLGGIFG